MPAAKLSIVCVLFLLTACAGYRPPAGPAVATQPDPVRNPVILSKPQITAIEAGLRRSLKDPDSARFGQFKAAEDGKGFVNVCGWVNARNSYGGYTGEKPFIGVLDPKKNLFGVAVIGGTQSEVTVALAQCRTYGIFL